MSHSLVLQENLNHPHVAVPIQSYLRKIEKWQNISKDDGRANEIISPKVDVGLGCLHILDKEYIMVFLFESKRGK